MKRISFETLQDLAPREGGLVDAETAVQHARHGKNQIVEVVGNPLWELLRDTLKDPMIWFLIGIGAVFLLVGDTSEAVVLLVALVPLVFMDAILHWRTQASTSGLKGQLASEVTVTRNGVDVRLDSAELVPGDLIVVSSGMFLPADGIFQAATELQVDESVLTGEALPMQKHRTTLDPFALAGAGEVAVEPTTLGYAGTRTLTGEGQLRVLFTGSRTSYGEIVQSVSRMPHERTPLQRSITRLVQVLIAAAAVFCVMLAAIRLYQGHGWLDALLSAATLAIAAIPEEFPVVFTFFLGVGVYRLARKRALVRRAVSVENIGRVTQICTDKTGTITVGHLTLTHLDAADGLAEQQVLQAALAASNPNGTDPVDIAIQELARQQALVAPSRLRIFPFTEDRKRETALVSHAPRTFTAYVKGAPETVLAVCSMADAERLAWREKTATWARAGHKVLACARKDVSQAEADGAAEPRAGFEFSGLLAFEDPPRPEVADAISYCQQHQIGVLMITGDHPDTAVAIARDIGLGGASPAVASAEDRPQEFEAEWLEQNPTFLKSLQVVARCTPLQKLRIVNALKQSGELVAVTGDGVNDVPALKAADIGIAMGERGTRSAKEVSSIVLADDNFRTIVHAIMEGRQLFSNLKMAFEYLLLIHIPFVVTAALLPSLGYPLLYLPVHVVWLELIIHPTALFAFQGRAEVEGTNEARTVFFSSRDSVRVLLLGVGFAVALAASFLRAYGEGGDVAHARSIALAALTCWSAGLVLVFTRLRNGAARWVFLGTLLSSVLLIQLPWLEGPLHLSALHVEDWAAVVGGVTAFVLLVVLGQRMKAKSVLGQPAVRVSA